MKDVMRLEAGSGWRGTFANTVVFAARSMLETASPVPDVSVTTYEGTTTGDLTDANAETVTVSGKVIDVDEIDAFEVDCS